MKSIILVAAHKNYDFPNDSLYVPIQLGAALREHLSNCKFRDNEGINISIKNPNYSELTALFWFWKNKKYITYDVVGLVHYRRYFKGKLSFKGNKILSKDEIDMYMSSYDILLPKKRNYIIETVRSHYKHAHFEKDLNLTEKIIKELYPEYFNVFNEVMNKTTLHLYNMFIMRRELYVQYCEWIFKILFEVEKYLDIENYDKYQRRVFGFLAERLFNVWVKYQQDKKGIKIKELKVINIEGEKFLYKGIKFMKRKLINERTD